MKDYKDITINRLCAMINRLGAFAEEDMADYRKLVLAYEDRREQEILAARDHEVYTSYANCVVLRDKEDGEITIKAYDSEMAEVMMRDVSKVICFSDCDDTFWVVKIIFNGREVEYMGWMPQMRYCYRYVDTGDIAWSGVFENWEH